jgi:flagellar biosynthesis protein FlhA
LLEAARITLGSTIGSLYSPQGTLPAITLAPPLEHNLISAIQSGDRGRTLAISASSAEDVVRQLARISHDAEARGTVPVVLCSTRLRPALRRLLRPSLPRLAVVGAGEIGASLPVETIGSVNDEAVALN